MGLFLQVLGVIFLILIAYVAIRVAILVGKMFLILWGIKKFTEQVQAEYPSELEVVEVAGARWDEDDARRMAEPLAGLGFREVGFFDAPILGGTRLQAWVHPDEGMYSVVYRSPRAGTWVDFVTKYEDGTSLTYSNSPHGGKLEQRPGRENVYFPGLGAEEMHQKMLADRPDRPTRRLSEADFVEDFRRAYAEDMAWRTERGDISPAAALAGLMSGKLGPEQAGKMRESFALRAYQFTAERLGEAYRSHAGIADEDWESLRDRLVFVYDDMSPDMLRSATRPWLDGQDDGPLAERLEEGDSIRREFVEFNRGLPEGRRLEPIGPFPPPEEWGEPREVDVYAAPA